MSDNDLDGIVSEIEKRIEDDEKRMFSERVLREARKPHKFGRIELPDSSASITGPCGDTMEFSMIFEGGRITDIRFMTDGCGPSIACGSMTTRMAEGRSLEEAYRLDDRDILRELGGLPQENRHCAKLAIDTLHKAIKQYRDKER